MALIISITIYYSKLHNVKEIIVMLATFFASVILFYDLFYLKINHFKSKSEETDITLSKTNKKSKQKIGNYPFYIGLIMPIIFMASKATQLLELPKREFMLIITFYLVSFIYMFATHSIIKFIYLKKENLI